MTQINLPFQVGQIIEEKSFLKGFRGAWFRCEILKTITEGNKLFYILKYPDYEDEEIHKTEVFQTRAGKKKQHLMIRPPYPPLYHESDVHKIKNEPEPLLVVHGEWRVGDLVDWLCKGCFWSGTIVELKDNKAVKIELYPKPIGEGETYEALCKDLRPSLDWSVEDGWKVPSSKDGNRKCGKLVKKKKEDQETAEVCETENKQTERAAQKSKVIEELVLNIMKSDSIDAPILDLEELIVRIQWVKSILRPDVGEGSKSNWKYEDYRPSSI